MFMNVLLAAVLAVCVITDVRSRRIYNNIVFPALLTAFAFHVWEAGWAGLGFAAGGFAVGLSVLLVPYLLGGIGAGDVKLLALVGAMKGASFVLAASLSMAICGGIMALGILLLRRDSWDWLRWMITFFYSLRHGVLLTAKGDGAGLATTYPYGVAIASGTVLCWVLNEWGNGPWLSW